MQLPVAENAHQLNRQGPNDDRGQPRAQADNPPGCVAKGVGLAATQVNIHERVVVIDTSEERNEPRVLINPEITWVSDEMIVWEEGCLSVPTVYDKVDRHARVKVRALNREGQTYEFEADEDLLSVCVQHELDHLLGKVFVEYLSRLKRNRIKTKLIKRARDEE